MSELTEKGGPSFVPVLRAMHWDPVAQADQPGGALGVWG